MLGFAMRSEPVFMNTVATSCAGMSVHIERTIARSSACAAVFAKRSLISRPDWPYFWNLNGEPIAVPPSIDLPFILFNAGFGSHVSTCDGAPCAKMWMMAFAFAGNIGGFGASGLLIAAG